MRTLTILALAALAGCAAATPVLDQQTGTTLAQRCIDYRATMAALEVAGETDSTGYIIAKAFVVANCPPPVPPVPVIIEPAA